MKTNGSQEQLVFREKLNHKAKLLLAVVSSNVEKDMKATKGVGFVFQ